MLLGCYVLDLYCDIEYAHLLDGKVNYKFAGGYAQYTDEHGSRARASARRNGWKIGRCYVVCPKCMKHTNAERRKLLHAAVAAGWVGSTRRTK
jgi:hypothetical protein